MGCCGLRQKKGRSTGCGARKKKERNELDDYPNACILLLFCELATAQCGMALAPEGKKGLLLWAHRRAQVLNEG